MKTVTKNCQLRGSSLLWLHVSCSCHLCFSDICSTFFPDQFLCMRVVTGAWQLQFAAGDGVLIGSKHQTPSLLVLSVPNPLHDNCLLCFKVHILRVRPNIDNLCSSSSPIVGKELHSTGHGHFGRATSLRNGDTGQVGHWVLGCFSPLVSREGNHVHKKWDFSPRHSHTLP